MLTDKYLAGIPSDSRAASATGFLKADQISSDKIAKVQRLQELSLARGQTLAQMALAWVLRHPEVTSALIGASKVEQVEDAVGLLEKPNFTADELQLIETILAS
jgi:L-glyceraldehyde 3-phosphate reductase